MEHYEKKYVDTGKGRIAYFLNIISPDAPFVVLLHGLSSNHTTWAGTMELLGQNGINSIAPDLRGHGFSDNGRVRSNYSFEVFADDVDRILAAEKITAASLIGYSLGGWIALEYTRRRPESVRRLVLVSASYRALYPLRPIAIAMLKFLAWIFLLQRRKEFPYFEHGKAKGYWDSTLEGLFTMPVSVGFWILIEILRFDARSWLPDISSPALIVYDKGDFYSSSAQFETMKREMPHAEIVELKTATHFLGSAGQELFAEKMIVFLRKTLSI